jgi:HJR/Mrr/RecB family endonuclease
MLELEKTFVDDKIKLILEFLNCSDSYKNELSLSDSHSKKLQYPIVRRKFYLSYDLAMIDKMEGFEFEKYVGRLFQEFDFSTTVTKQSGDFGCDVILEKNGDRIAVQVKRSTNTVSLKAVQEIVASLKKYDARIGVVITNATFSKSAKQLAKSNGVVMINGRALVRFIDMSKMEKSRRRFGSCAKQIRIIDSKLNLSGDYNFSTCTEPTILPKYYEKLSLIKI